LIEQSSEISNKYLIILKGHNSESTSKTTKEGKYASHPERNRTGTFVYAA
jgi:hypothetical protein